MSKNKQKNQPDEIDSGMVVKFVDCLEEFIWEVLHEKEKPGETNIKAIKEKLIKIMSEE